MKRFNWTHTTFVAVFIMSAYLLANYLIRKSSYLDYAKDNTRFIAHAGGQIEGKNYTNSFEALELSYKKGFRIFELDIIKTSDNYFVAAHDWGKWKKITEFKGDIPPTRDQFLSYKIYNKYTPMDLTLINDWFAAHLDTILVTDKTNEPKVFSDLFVDKKRLMMELFTWEKVKVGIKSGIKSAMPTGNLIKSIKGNKVDFLNNIGISEIAMSRKILVNDKELIQLINSLGIRIYAFHINERKKRGVNYVICRERQYFYGMYANKWNQNYLPNCDHINL